MKLLSLALLFAAAPAFAASSAESLYNQMAGNGFQVQYTSSEGRALVGSSLTEKSTPDTICQKAVAVAPNAEPMFRCYQKLATDHTAKGVYEATDGNVLNVSFFSEGSMLLGASTQQKFVKGGFCRKLGAVVPQPIYSYACYAQIN